MSSMQDRLDTLIAQLRARGYRLTPQRIAVLKVLVSERSHPTVEEIYRKVKADLPTTSLATIYKVLDLLQSLGEVQELRVEGSSRYDVWQPLPHPHLICVSCGRIEDLEELPLEAPRDEVERRTGYRILTYRLDFFGLCPQCQQKGQASS
ncbi:MAG: Fur family transcriptional regulator [Anaerolineae bacterium]